MKLKKINDNLQQALIEMGLTEPNEMQRETWSTIKSGSDVVVVSGPQSGKTTTMAINVCQKLQKPFEQSPRALIIVLDREKALETEAIFKEMCKHSGLRVFMTHDKTDLDDDKNQISVGIDILIGTPLRLNEMFGSAGFDVNQLKMFIIDDCDLLLKSRFEPKLIRLSDAIGKTQRLFFAQNITERLDFLADREMIEPYWFDMDADEEDEAYFDDEDFMDETSDETEA
ncbi:DEAD/DEAH box helicase [Flavobacterium agricola]|uniref:DEAD/DEAH box helicase n=1 Tax=Flavobacterium agricola TaxID=2870839 RepID=A0ABY6LZH7_9FLAO|nr:DEAD/DEAH box helicase [Flavobacterium agricola]UYW00298.1 DEAD/DEAH box helicase [Flavobacterium agricola]